MKIKRQHGTNKEKAIQKINYFLDELMKREFPGGIKIRNATKKWDGDTMSFSFKAKKGLMGSTITGRIQVTNDSITLHSELPGLVASFVSEEKIKEVINNQFNDLFNLA